MIVVSKEHMTILAVEALKAAKQRGIIVGGWAGLSLDCLAGSPHAEELINYAKGNVLFLKSAPHEWLFSRCACAVHHGGMGTSQASLGAGVPTVITPVFCDQFDIANLVANQKVGRRTSQLAKVTAEELAHAIEVCCISAEIRDAATDLRKRMAAEDGCLQALELIKTFFSDEVQSGAWRHKQKQYKIRLGDLRRHYQELTTGAALLNYCPMWTIDLAQKYPSIGQYWQFLKQLDVELADVIKQKNLWYVKAGTCLVRSSESDESPALGRYHELALLQEVARNGSRLHVWRRKGSGPVQPGWVSVEAGGKRLLERVESVKHLREIHDMATWQYFQDVW